MLSLERLHPVHPQTTPSSVSGFSTMPNARWPRQKIGIRRRQRPVEEEAALSATNPGWLSASHEEVAAIR
jgi:hypothetical protein